MKLDFSVPITGYEIIAITVSIIALIMPWIITFIKKFIIKTRLEVYPTNQLKLLYNESGSYINIDFSIECKYKNAIVQNIETTITRENDGKKLELIQSVFKSPIFSSIGNNLLSSNETAHPFKICAGELTNIFLEEAIKNSEFINELKDLHDNKMNDFSRADNYEKDITDFKNNDKYNKLYAELFEGLFWKKGNYIMQLKIYFNNKKTLKKDYIFKIEEKDASLIEKNVEESLICRIKNIYNIPMSFHYCNVDYNEIKKIHNTKL